MKENHDASDIKKINAFENFPDKIHLGLHLKILLIGKLIVCLFMCCLIFSSMIDSRLNLDAENIETIV